jgi:hypothetical protein
MVDAIEVLLWGLVIGWSLTMAFFLRVLWVRRHEPVLPPPAVEEPTPAEVAQTLLYEATLG